MNGLYVTLAISILYVLIQVFFLFSNRTFSSILLDGYKSQYCLKGNHEECSHELKNKKFILLYIDSLAYDQIDVLEQQFKDKAMIFKLKQENFKQSGSLAETLFTGKFSQNYVAKNSESDNIINQMISSNYKLKFEGVEFPLYSLFIRKHLDSFSKVNLKDRRESFPLQSICPLDLYYSLLQNSNNGWDREYIKSYYSTVFIGNSFLGSCLDDIMSTKHDGYIFYTPALDHFNHSISKSTPLNYVVTYLMQRVLLEYINWIANFPEYTLIILSDHGGQKFPTEDDFCNHGCSVDNEGVLIIYSKKLESKIRKGQDLIEITNNDVSAIIASIIEGLNIPLESRGFPSYIIDDFSFNLKALRLKEQQIKEYINAVKLKYKYTFEEYIPFPDFNERIQNSSDYLINFKEYLEEYATRMEIKAETFSGVYLYTFIGLISILAFKQKSTITFLRKSINLNSKELVLSEGKLKFFALILLFSYYIDFIFFFYSPLDFTETFKLLVIFRLAIESVLLFFLLCSLKWPSQIASLPNSFTAIFATVLGIKNLICFVFCFFDLFTLLKKTFHHNQMSDNLDIFNYIILAIYCLSFIWLKKATYGPNCRLLWEGNLLIIYVISSFFLMICYDFFENRNFNNQDFDKPFLARIFYCLIGLQLFSFVFEKRKYQKNDLENEHTCQSSSSWNLMSPQLSNFNLTFVLFFFFINDSIERAFMLVFVVPSYIGLSELICFVSRNKKYNSLTLVMLHTIFFGFSDILVVSMQKRFSFDISLAAGDKTIGTRQDDYPIFTGFLFVFHKLQNYVIASGFLLRIAQFETTETYQLRLSMTSEIAFCILELKVLFTIFFNILIAWFDYQTFNTPALLFSGNYIFILLFSLIPIVLLQIKEYLLCKHFSYSKSLKEERATMLECPSKSTFNHPEQIGIQE